MKTTFKFIIAALSAIAVFASCQKELGEKTSDSGQKDGLRVITVQFDNPTKASLGSDGLTPTFTNNDKIRVSNLTKSEKCTVTVDGATATFTTTLSGALTAIYPADAAVLSSGEADAPIATSNNIKVPAYQDGTIAKAIIAKAEIANASSCATATFRCQTALFQITPPAGATTFTVTSLKAVVSGARTGDAVAINTEGANDAAKRVITVSVPSDGTAYVALKAGVNLTDLSFDADETYGMKGIPAKDITAAGKTDATAANTKYTINNGNWHPYVTIDGKKWATMNVGATSETDAGHYFAWGYAEGCVRNTAGSGWVLASDNTTVKDFGTEDFPNRDASSFQDAATSNWGGSWRMPTKAEFEALVPGNWVTDPGDGRKFGSLNKIFLPAAGYGSGTSLNEVDIPVRGYYWSSSLYELGNADLLNFDSSSASTCSYTCCNGRSVRALSE